jgi:ABC-type nitrate/sulfonate/bicarbonate transport system permease component
VDLKGQQYVFSWCSPGANSQHALTSFWRFSVMTKFLNLIFTTTGFALGYLIGLNPLPAHSLKPLQQVTSSIN